MIIDFSVIQFNVAYVVFIHIIYNSSKKGNIEAKA